MTTDILRAVQRCHYILSPQSFPPYPWGGWVPPSVSMIGRGYFYSALLCPAELCSVSCVPCVQVCSVSPVCRCVLCALSLPHQPLPSPAQVLSDLALYITPHSAFCVGRLCTSGCTPCTTCVYYQCTTRTHYGIQVFTCPQGLSG